MGDSIVFLDTDAAEPSGDSREQEIHALRLRAADALERGLEFVDAHGDEEARCLARVVLRAEAASSFEGRRRETQSADGAFAAGSAHGFGLVGRALGFACETDPVLATGATLVWLADVRALRAPSVPAAVRFLEAAQHPDGHFGPSEETGEAAVATALIGGALGRTREVHPECLQAAGDYLAARWTPDRVEGAGLGPILAWSHYFTNTPHDAADEILQWCGRELEKGFRSGAREALETARILTVCDVAALPGSAIAPHDLLTVLLGEQASDGGFDALCADGVAGRVVPTIEAMRAMIGMCAGLDE